MTSLHASLLAPPRWSGHNFRCGKNHSRVPSICKKGVRQGVCYPFPCVCQGAEGARSHRNGSRRSARRAFAGFPSGKSGRHFQDRHTKSQREDRAHGGFEELQKARRRHKAAAAVRCNSKATGRATYLSSCPNPRDRLLRSHGLSPRRSSLRRSRDSPSKDDLGTSTPTHGAD